MPQINTGAGWTLNATSGAYEPPPVTAAVTDNTNTEIDLGVLTGDPVVNADDQSVILADPGAVGRTVTINGSQSVFFVHTGTDFNGFHTMPDGQIVGVGQVALLLNSGGGGYQTFLLS